jgi:peroxiredoxin
MRSTLFPGAEFPDFVLPDHTNVTRRLSHLQSDRNMVVVLARGALCPKDRLHHDELVRFHPQLIAGFTQVVTITTDDRKTASTMREEVGAQWPFLIDEERIVQRELEIKDHADLQHDVMIPHTIVLKPGLIVHKIYNGHSYWGRPSMAELHQDLREAARELRAQSTISRAPDPQARIRGSSTLN